MDGSSERALGRTPRDRAVEGPVELERARSVAIGEQPTAIRVRQALAADPCELARRDVGEDEVGARELVDRARDVNRAAELAQPRHQRIRESLGASAREGPADSVPEGHERETEACARPPLERKH